MSQLNNETLEKMVKNGFAYSNEVRDMAKELLELRAKYNTTSNTDNSIDYNPYRSIFP